MNDEYAVAKIAAPTMKKIIDKTMLIQKPQRAAFPAEVALIGVDSFCVR